MSGGGWNEGYVVDVSYTEQVFGVLTPTWLSFIAAIHGQPPIDFGRTLTYIELGCGNGLTSCLVAASTPKVEVWACDFNPAHVERARSIASRSGLTNCTFEEVSFEELAANDALGPHDVDIIVLHGVYSWVGARNRKYIVDIIRRRLAPGGLVCVSYNVLTGWASMLPIREAMRLHAERDPRSSVESIRAAIATLRQLAEDGARSFPLGRSEQQVFEMMRELASPYLAHEYLSGSFTPLMFADVVRDLAMAKCDFVGTTHPTDAQVRLRLPGGLVDHDLVNGGDRVITETVCDFAGGTTFRSDVFRRGLAPRPPHEHELALAELSFAHLGQAFDVDTPITTPFASVRLDPARYGAVVERLAESPATLGELAELPALLGEPMREVVATIAMLARIEQVGPVVSGWEVSERASRTRRFNELLLDEARRGRPHDFVASPALGSLLGCPALTLLSVGELWDRPDFDDEALAAAVRGRVMATDLAVDHQGQRATTDEETAAAIGAAIDQARQLFSGAFARLGVS